MKTEINETTYKTQNYYNPAWWDKWSKKNYKKKRWLFSRINRKPAFVPKAAIGLQYMVLVTIGLI